MKAKSSNRKQKFTPLTVFMLVILSLYSLSLLGILVWAVFVSLDSSGVFNQKGIIDFSQLRLKNFEFIFTMKIQPTQSGTAKVNVFQTIGFSALYSIGCAFINVTVTCLTAYFASKFKFKYSKILYLIVIVTMSIPLIGTLPSEILTTKGYLFGGTFDIFFGNDVLREKLKMYGTFWGSFIMKASFIGMYFLIFYEYFDSLPQSYFESAKIDGANNLQILFKIALPLVSSLFFTVFLIQFVFYWNDYQAPMVYLKPYPTVSFVIFDEANYGKITRGIVPRIVSLVILGISPTLITFLATHKKMMGNLTVGGIKG